MDLNNIKKLNIPALPGCYKFFNKQGKAVYIGKAANLKSRVLSYWQKGADHTPAKEDMIKQVFKISWEETDSEVEALLLEANLIKKYKPYYNILLRDDKRFAYIKISMEEKYPRIFMTRKIDKSGKYFGPFTSMESVRETLKIIRKIWPYRSCRILPKKVCLYYRIGKCPGLCEEKISQMEYKKIIKEIVAFLSGKKKAIVKNYEKKIKQAGDKNADKLNYQLNNLKKVLAAASLIGVGEKYENDAVELSKVLGLERVLCRIEGYDISNIFGQEAVGSMVVFSNGEPEKNEYRKFKIKINAGLANDTGMLKEVLERRLKHSVILEGVRRVGERPIESHEAKIKRDATTPASPNRRALGRVALLQYDRSWPLPDLIVVDGARAQLNTVLSVLKKNKLDIPVIAIAKGLGLRSALAPDKIFFPGEKKPLELPLASPALHLIKRVRDEAHRFAISYHRKLRSKKIFT
jgi:excinuclease ABC subunit C